MLLYHCTHYTLRGSDTVRGIYCGTFCNRFNDTYGDRYWHFGTTLSFKPFSTHYTFHGGFSALGAGSGALCVHLASIVGSAAWYYGAALLLLHIMLIVADLLLMDMLVACFIFLLMELLVSLIGIVVLLYHLTSYYAIRGGRSNLGNYSGFLYIALNTIDFWEAWHYGADLLIYTLCYSLW